MKHAFLIIAHGDYEVLRTLIRLLDDDRYDIYIMVDKTSPLPERLETHRAKLSMLKKRVDIRWGHVSQIKAEIALFEAASANGPYGYYHLLSGVDLPIKNLDYIFDFFERNAGKEFVGFTRKTDWLDKVMKYQFFIRYYKMKGRLGTAIKAISYRLEHMANKLHKRSDEAFRKGSNWVSITEDFCRYLLGKKNWIKKRFRYTFCGDEIFLQTVLWNSPFREHIYSLHSESDGNQREIIWENNNPHIWGSSSTDIEKLQASDKLFARKFSPTYPEMIRKVQLMVINK